MKPHKNIFRRIADFENLYQAFLMAAKGRRFRDEILAFAANLEENLIELQNELIHQTYEIGRYREFYIQERKKRLIMAIPFRDRVVQWGIYRVLFPLFSNGFIEDSYGCMPGRGAHKAVERVQYWMRLMEHRGERGYFLKLDISKFFYRVDHAVLMEILRRKLADDQLMWLLDRIVNSEDTAFGLPLGYNPGETDVRVADKGMPIGNLTSQMFANVYLNELDQYVKRKLRIRYYARYMDDIIIFSDSKLLLHEYKKIIEKFLNEELKLHLNNKTAIRPITLGLDFCGYKTWPTHIRLRKSTALGMKRRLKVIRIQYANGEIELDKVKETMASYMGLMQHCNSYNLRKKIADTFVLKKNNPEKQHQ